MPEPVSMGLKLAVPLAPLINLIYPKIEPRSKYFTRLSESEIARSDFNEAANIFGYIDYPKVIRLRQSGGGFKAGKRSRSSNVTKQDRIQAKDFNKYQKSLFKKVICDFECEYIDHTGTETKILSAKKIFNSELLPLFQSNDSKTVIIEGTIGCGKSTLITSLMYCAESVGATKISNAQPLFVRVDLRELLEDSLDDIIKGDSESAGSFCGKIEEIIVKSVDQELRLQDVISGNSCGNFVELQNRCKERQKRLVVVMDELDVLYYSFSLATISGCSVAEHDIVVQRYGAIVESLMTLADKRSIGGPYAMIVLLAARTSSIVLARDASRQSQNFTGQSIPLNPDLRIKINRPDSSRLLELIRSWCEWVSEQNKNSSGGLSGAINEIDKSNANLLELNLKISVHGVRHIMKVLRKSLHIDSSGELFREYLANPQLLRMFQYLDGCKKASQTTEGVSHIFLVDGNFESSSEKMNPSFPKNLRRDHLQTYWLKYLLIRFICVENRMGGDGGVLISRILNIFSFEGHESGNNFKKFESETILLIILHATEVLHGKLLNAKIRPNDSESSVFCTDRANAFQDELLYWRFEYLSVCIEDNWLSFPVNVKDHFVCRNSENSFSFVANLSNLGQKKSLDFLINKTKHVLKFLELLKVSLEFEKRRYSDVFVRLSELHPEEFNYHDWNNDCFVFASEDCDAFSARYLDDAHITRYRKAVDEFKKGTDFSDFSKKLSSTFRSYEKTFNPFVTTGALLKRWHKER